MYKTSMTVTQDSFVVATYRSLFAGLYLWRRVGAWGLTFSRSRAEAECLRDLEPTEAPEPADTSYPPAARDTFSRGGLNPEPPTTKLS